jgi:penicillin-binding protein 1A
MKSMARSLPRDRILEIYLNESYFGHSAYGVAAASEAFFGKSLDRLDVDEIALIVALARTPYLPRLGADRTVERRNFVIERMFQAGLINPTEAASARQRLLNLRGPPSSTSKQL